ncbi:MAG: PQQ-dependent sugar dehydrogenase [Myxococcales bacterium]|nr:PQQ-dependent sugar dehydrogenase [Myxococcales bacterium]MBK7194433.1 PQQ-dependent sugar dehydrogenase [Myxococcales bacterium]MBP6849626.1 PQQ-dependent sugar dehydrogenase [Kofleriaceae bacterium]
MRQRLAALALSVPFAACGGGSPPIDASVTDDGLGPDAPFVDAPTTIDAAPIDGPSANCTPVNGTNIVLTPVAQGLDSPVGLTSPPGDRRIFVVEQTGAIRLIKDGALVTAPYLNLGGAAGPVLSGGERGLLGLAFHPQFATNGKFYVDFTRKTDGATVIAEFTAAAPGDDTAPAASRRDVLVIPQPFANHNAGWLEFGPDGKLYIAMGDGGSGGDPQDRAQNDAQLLGKLLRIDVDARTGTKPYGIPADNPFASSPDGAADPRPEIWGKGLRNPFRFGFDTGTGDLYIADVGQNAWEEVNAGPNLPSMNWGWDDREGRHCYEPTTGCLTAGRTEPVVEHSHNAGWISVIGGVVYRGSCFPDLVGSYFYGDYGQRGLWSFKLMGGVAMNDREVVPNVGQLSHVSHDATGEIYVVTMDGRVRRITATP